MEAAPKQRRSVIKRQKKEAAKLAASKGAVTAKLRNIPTSPRKMRLVADLVRGQQASMALSVLKFQPKTGAAMIEKLLLTAISDWQAKNADVRLEDADLYIKAIFVDGGRILKRLRPAPQGRAHRIRKRSNHITLVLDSKNAVAAQPVVEAEAPVAEVKETKAKAPKATKEKASAKKTTSKKTDKK